MNINEFNIDDNNGKESSSIYQTDMEDDKNVSKNHESNDSENFIEEYASEAKKLKLDKQVSNDAFKDKSEGESEYEEITDDDEDSDDAVVTTDIIKATAKVKRKRKRKNPNLRRNIRNVFSDKNLDTQTKVLREKEQERLKRLGLSNNSFQLPHPNGSFAPFIGTLKKPIPSQPKPHPEVICLDSDSEDERKVTPNLFKPNFNSNNKNEILILSSDSEDDDGHDFDTILDKRVQTDDYYSELGLHANDELNIPQKDSGQVLININHSNKDKDVFLSKSISNILKPHQIGGVRFLYDNLIESVHDFRSYEGNGCILAHAMGLGKTIQTISFIDIFLRFSPAKKVLCVVPVNTIQNWVNEFNRWLPPKPVPYQTSVQSSIVPFLSATSKIKKVKKNPKKLKQEKVSKRKVNIKKEQSNFNEIQILLADMIEFVSYTVNQELAEESYNQSLNSSLMLPVSSQSTGDPIINTNKICEQTTLNQISNENSSEYVPNLLQGIEIHLASEYTEIKTEPKSATDDKQILSLLSHNIKPRQSEKTGGTDELKNSNFLKYDNELKQSEKMEDENKTDIDIKTVLNDLVTNVCQNEEDEKKKTYREFQLFMIDAQKNFAGRARVIEKWDEVGGVLLIGYEMYRSISMCKARKKKSSKNEDIGTATMTDLKAALCKPGPDLVVCDEGHRIRNYQSGISQALKSIKTRKRLVLTGYPLQNNLIEYWCMVDFVRPNYLGSRQEFANMFERPIMNGQCVDSTDKDKLLMRQRAHVLYSLLQGFVQRRGHDVLKKSLPAKQEYVLMVRLSPIQKALYRRLIELTKEAYSDSLNPIKTFCLCCKIWNHPDILYNAIQARQQGKLVDIISDEDDIPLDDASSTSKPKRKRKPTVPVNDSHISTTTSNVGFDPFGTEAREMLADIPQWAGSVFRKNPYQVGEIENSGKFVVLKKIIDESVSCNDKLLVFSQSLFTLSTIEVMLQKNKVHDKTDACWVKGRHYYRLDGSTNSAEREKLINAFNKKDNDETRVFLLSTRAGCLGINLIGANRVVVFDVSWNPCHDAQAVCRVYRYGQQKPCFIYRLVSSNTMEKKIYYRQISKQGISDRVVDEMSLTENFSKSEIQSLMMEEWTDESELSIADRSKFYKDHILQSILTTNTKWISKVPFKHESLLISESSNRLSGMEKRAAKKAYEEERSMIQGNLQPYNRCYPLQRNFPQNTPVAPVRPFLWRPPTTSWLENSNSLHLSNVASNITLQSTSSSREMTDQVLRLLHQSRDASYSSRFPPPSIPDTTPGINHYSSNALLPNLLDSRYKNEHTDTRRRMDPSSAFMENASHTLTSASLPNPDSALSQQQQPNIFPSYPTNTSSRSFENPLTTQLAREAAEFMAAGLMDSHTMMNSNLPTDYNYSESPMSRESTSFSHRESEEESLNFDFDLSDEDSKALVRTIMEAPTMNTEVIVLDDD